MTTINSTPIEITRFLAPDIEAVLGVSSLAAELDKVDTAQSTDSNRDMLGDIGAMASIASILIVIVPHLKEYLLGNTMQGASEEQVIERITTRILGDESLGEKTKKELITQLLNKMKNLDK